MMRIRSTGDNGLLQCVAWGLTICVVRSLLEFSRTLPTSHAFVQTTQSHRASRLQSALSNDSLFVEKDHSALEFIHNETNCEVVLLGCLHGSQSSAAHVERQLLCEKDTHVVVLELCASRCADLQRVEETTTQPKESVLSSWTRLIKAVSKTIQKRGLATGIATVVLGSASGLQTALSGFEPGLEFTTAMKLVSSDMENCDVVLADQAVDETLRRFGSLPLVSLEMMQEWIKSGFDWDETYANESNALQWAIFGQEDYQPKQVNMIRFLTQDKVVRGDVFRLTLPPLLFVQFFFLLVQSIFQAIDGNSVMLSPLDQLGLIVDSSLSLPEMLAVASELVSDLMLSAVLLGLGYTALALPAERLILCERDDQLAKGVRAACELAASKSSNAINDDSSKDIRGRVVVVLGLLHVNGVAKRLLTQQHNQQSTTPMEAV